MKSVSRSAAPAAVQSPLARCNVQRSGHLHADCGHDRVDTIRAGPHCPALLFAGTGRASSPDAGDPFTVRGMCPSGQTTRGGNKPHAAIRRGGVACCRNPTPQEQNNPHGGNPGETHLLRRPPDPHCPETRQLHGSGGVRSRANRGRKTARAGLHVPCTPRVPAPQCRSPPTPAGRCLMQARAPRQYAARRWTPGTLPHSRNHSYSGFGQRGVPRTRTAPCTAISPMHHIMRYATPRHPAALARPVMFN